MRKKVRRASGRRCSKRYDPENGMYNTVYWDDWWDYRDGMRNGYAGIDDSLIKRKSQANHGKISNFHTARNFRTGKITEYYDDGFEKIHKNNMKLKILLRRRKAMKETRNESYMGVA